MFEIIEFDSTRSYHLKIQSLSTKRNRCFYRNIYNIGNETAINTMAYFQYKSCLTSCNCLSDTIFCYEVNNRKKRIHKLFNVQRISTF